MSELPPALFGRHAAAGLAGPAPQRVVVVGRTDAGTRGSDEPVLDVVGVAPGAVVREAAVPVVRERRGDAVDGEAGVLIEAVRYVVRQRAGGLSLTNTELLTGSH